MPIRSLQSPGFHVDGDDEESGGNDNEEEDDDHDLDLDLDLDDMGEMLLKEKPTLTPSGLRPIGRLVGSI